MKKRVKVIIELLLLSVVFLTLGVTYAFLTYSKTGDKKTEIILGNIEFSYIEGRSATLANAYPLADEIGAKDETGEYTFEVGLKSSSNEKKMAYDVILVSANEERNKVFNNDQIKYALIKEDLYVGGTSATNGLKLSEIEGFDANTSTGEGIALKNQIITAGEKDEYKLRIWISEDVDYSNNEDENISQGLYNGYTYSLRVRINGKEYTQLAPGFYDINDNLVVSWEDSGINVDIDYTFGEENSYITSETSAYNVLNRYENAVKVIVPDNVKKIGDYAFYRCENLVNIDASNVTSIGNNSFWGDDSLIGINMPNLKEIGDGAFSSCYNLTNIDLSKVTNIGEESFAGCESLVSINIPKSLTSIGERAFKGCSNLASITVDSDNEYYDSRNNSNAIIETASNTLIVGCNNTVIPVTVTSIGEYAFYYCENLVSIDAIGVTSIGEVAFGNCENLTSVNLPNATQIGYSAFSSCYNLTSINIPKVIEIGKYAFYDCSSLTSINIPSSVTSIGESAFESCEDLTSVTFVTTTDWYIGNMYGAKTTLLSSTDLSNTSTAANYLKDTYVYKYWTRDS